MTYGCIIPGWQNKAFFFLILSCAYGFVQVEALPPATISLVQSEDERGVRRREERLESWDADVQTGNERYLTTFTLRFLRDMRLYFDKTYYLRLENTQGYTDLAFLLRERGCLFVVVVVVFCCSLLLFHKKI
jgi:hypothetical protein